MQTVQIKRWVETHLVRVSANGSLAFPGITGASANGIWQKVCKRNETFHASADNEIKKSLRREIGSASSTKGCSAVLVAS